jgi:predicted Zn finger-like uncharacterized protein
MIHFACPHCHAAYTVPDGAVGKKTTCSKCQQRLQVPGQSTIAPLAIPLPQDEAALPPLPPVPAPLPAARTRQDVGDEEADDATPRRRAAPMVHRSFDNDDAEEEDRMLGQRRRSKPVSALSIILGIINLAVWGLLLVAVGFVGLAFLGSLSNANGAPQEAAIGAVCSTFFIGLYIAARCIEKLAAAIERMRAK